MSSKLIASTMGEQEAKLEQLFLDVFKQSRRVVYLNDAGIQKLFVNRDKFQEGAIALLAKFSSVDDRFELLNSFELVVSPEYTHETQIAGFKEFAKNKSEKFFDISKMITDENYARVTGKLVPSSVYGIKIFGIKQRVSSEDCLAFLASQCAIFVGAQGLSLLRQHKMDEFPVSKWMISFDEKDALWQDPIGSRGVPYMYRHSGGSWIFDVGSFADSLTDGYRLLCVYDLNS